MQSATSRAEQMGSQQESQLVTAQKGVKRQGPWAKRNALHGILFAVVLLFKGLGQEKEKRRARME